jgi:signal recognition particle receptor subunit beta
VPYRENSVIVFNIFLCGSQESGKKTFIHWFIENGNLPDANFLNSIKLENEILTDRINLYIKNIKEYPRLMKQSVDELIQNGQFKEAETYFEIAKYRIYDLINSYDKEINKSVKKSLNDLKSSNEIKMNANEPFSFIDVTGSTPSMIYRIYYPTDKIPSSFELSNFLSSMDGLIFIWDAQRNLIEENYLVFQQIFNELPPNTQMPLIIALNKVDLPNALRTEDLRRLLAELQFEERLQTSLFTDSIFHELTIFETVGIQGINIHQVLRNCVRMIVLKHKSKIQELRLLLVQEAPA